LSFDNLSADPSQSYVADGISDTLITDLAKVPGLLVIARHTAFQYKAGPWAAADLARELRVQYVLHGSVQREEKRLRVNAHLTNATTGNEMWAERYHGSAEDIFGLQDRIARNVVSILAINLTAAESDKLSSQDTDNLEAYEYFLRGRERYYRFSREENLAARDFYLEAIELDPNFARVYAMLALTYRQEFVAGWSPVPEQALESAMQLAEKAISLDEAIPEAYFVKGLVHRERREFFDAMLAAEKAIAIDPNYADGYVVKGSVLYLAGQAEEGLELVEKAMRLNPHFPHIYQLCQGQALYVMGSYSEAVNAFRQGIDRYPQSERLHLWLAASYAQIGEPERAKGHMKQLYALNPDFSLSFLEQGSAFRYETDLENFLDGVRKATRVGSGINSPVTGSVSQPQKPRDHASAVGKVDNSP
jgi:adenylate cyclase